MNRALTILLTLTGAAAGFAIGWKSPTAGPGKESDGRAGRSESIRQGPLAPENSPPPVVDPLPAMVELNTVADCRSWLREADRAFAGRHPLIRRAARDYALRRWLELDAESALTEAEAKPGFENAVDGFAADLFRVWLDLNADSALNAWNQASPVLARNIRAHFLTTLADKDPVKALAAFESPRGKSGRDLSDPVEDVILRHLAAIDPLTAAGKATSERSLASVLSTWGRSNPQEALAFIARGQTGEDSVDARCAFTWSDFFGTAMRTDPATVRRIIDGAREEVLSGAASAWADSDPDNALRWAEAQSATDTLAVFTRAACAARLADSDPEKALAIARRIPDKPELQWSLEWSGALRQAFAALAATDQERAIALVEENPAFARNGGITGCLDQAFASDPEAALVRCRNWLSQPALKDEVTAGILKSLASRNGFGDCDPGRILEALPELKASVDGHLLSSWVRVNPVAAAKFIAERAASGQPVANLEASGTLAQLAISQPEYTGLWLQRLPDEALQHEAATTLAANWSAFDPESAVRWIDSLPDGPLHDAALAGYDRVRKSSKPDDGE